MPETTSRNLGLIREFPAARAENVSWLDEIIAAPDEKPLGNPLILNLDAPRNTSNPG
jgi:hypothetical protein